jgi:hypothetical protein
MHAVKMSVLDGGWDESGMDLQETIKIRKNSVAELELERNTSGGNVMCLKVKSCVTCTYQR